MPKIIKSFTVHLKNRKTSVEEMYEYLTKQFGPDWNKEHTEQSWYLGRNYSRPFTESHIEITFFMNPNSRHTMMFFEHPFKIIYEDAEQWYEVPDEIFNKFFEVK